MSTFENQVALITGGSLGIGRATVLEFAARGARVVIAARGVEQGKALQAEITQAGGDALYLQADMAKATDIEALIAETVKHYGRLDHAVNNAAAEVIPASVAELSESDVENTLNVNLRAVWLCMKLQVKQMLQQGGGTIVNVASINGLSGTPTGSIYSASKHGVIGLTRSAALEYIRQGIRINSVCPGLVLTPRRERRWANLTLQEQQEAKNELAESIPIGRCAEPREIAAAIIWLSSTESSYVVGQELIVDGGLSA
ncbi:MAG TPA: glucose 1-dehydrogenase [Nodosilinea sp.]|nr:glucose 1-dehydrogenase [Nodosilinea sp.]